MTDLQYYVVFYILFIVNGLNIVLADNIPQKAKRIKQCKVQL